MVMSAENSVYRRGGRARYWVSHGQPNGINHRSKMMSFSSEPGSSIWRNNTDGMATDGSPHYCRPRVGESIISGWNESGARKD